MGGLECGSRFRFQLVFVWMGSEAAKTSRMQYRNVKNVASVWWRRFSGVVHTVRMAFASGGSNCKGALQKAKVKHTRSKTARIEAQIVLILFSANRSNTLRKVAWTR